MWPTVWLSHTGVLRWPVASHAFSFSHTSAANSLDAANGVSNSRSLYTIYTGHCQTLFFLPGIIFLFIMCVGIISDNSLVESGLTQTEL